MGLLDDLKKVMAATDEDEDDFFEGASESYRPAPRRAAEEADFERAFADTRASAPAPASQPDDADEDERPSLFGNFGRKQASAPKKPAFRSGRGVPGEQIVFTPQTVDDASRLITYLRERRTVIMSLDEADPNFARRLLDFCLGITLALDGKLTQISGATFLITPAEVDVINSNGTALKNETL